MEALKPLIDQLTQMIKDGYDLGKDQLPEVAKQIIRYSLWSEGLGLLFSLLFSGITGWFAVKLFYAINRSNSDMDGRWVGLFILGGITGGLMIAAFYEIDILLKINMAPKLFLLDTISSYLQK